MIKKVKIVPRTTLRVVFDAEMPNGLALANYLTLYDAVKAVKAHGYDVEYPENYDNTIGADIPISEPSVKG